MSDLIEGVVEDRDYNTSSAYADNDIQRPTEKNVTCDNSLSRYNHQFIGILNEKNNRLARTLPSTAHNTNMYYIFFPL